MSFILIVICKFVLIKLRQLGFTNQIKISELNLDFGFVIQLTACYDITMDMACQTIRLDIMLSRLII